MISSRVLRNRTSSSSSSSLSWNLLRYASIVRMLYIGVVVLTFSGPVLGKIGYFWHITDIHLDYFYSPKGEPLRSCWHSDHHSASSNRVPGRFGDYLCDSPWSLLESATLAMKSRQGDNVEFVLWTGDGLSHSAHRLLESTRLDILRNITELLGRTFPSQFVFPVLGHEDGSISDFRLLGELWRHWLPSEALQTFEKGGYYTIEQTKSRLRIIALNTNFMRHDPKYSHSQAAAAVRQRPNSMGGIGGTSGLDFPEYKHFYYHHGGGGGGGEGHHYQGAVVDQNIYDRRGSISHYGSGLSGSMSGGSSSGNSGGQVSALSGYNNQDTEKQWRWLEEMLEKSKINKETVYIVGHIPPGSDERQFGSQQNGHTTFTEKNNLRYLRLVRKYSSIIQGQFFGHLHSDSFRIIYNDLGKPVSWIMISPSVTPRKLSVGSNNPAMRLYKFDTDTGQVLDYTQYYLDLVVANAGDPNWQPEYNLTHYYGLVEVSSVSLHNLADRFTNTENLAFSKYYRANSVRYPIQKCEGVCALNHYCAITRVDYVEFRECLESAASALASRSPTSLIAYSPSMILLIVPFLLALNAPSNSLRLQIVSMVAFIRPITRIIRHRISKLIKRTTLPPKPQSTAEKLQQQKQLQYSKDQILLSSMALSFSSSLSTIPVNPANDTVQFVSKRMSRTRSSIDDDNSSVCNPSSHATVVRTTTDETIAPTKIETLETTALSFATKTANFLTKITRTTQAAKATKTTKTEFCKNIFVHTIRNLICQTVKLVSDNFNFKQTSDYRFSLVFLSGVIIILVSNLDRTVCDVSCW